MNLPIADGSAITVYNFRMLDSGFETAAISTFKATRQAIVDIFGGDPLEGTGQKVDKAELDAQGRYRRIATGWGELS
jgi:hypothetical protein